MILYRILIKMAFFSSALLESPARQVLTLVSGSKILVARLAEASCEAGVTELSVSGDDSCVQCAALSPSNSYLCVSTDNKTLAVWWQKTEEDDDPVVAWQQLGSRVLPKRPMALCFTSDEKWVVVADKTGEVYRYGLDGIDRGSGQHLLGHFSMLLDMILSPDDSHIITCDRDEKIRVSKFPNSYNIQTYCLGHTEFVTSICLYPANHSILLSGSGDGTLRAWHWREGKLLDSWKCLGDNGHSKGVVKVCCSSHDPPVIVAMVESSPRLVILSLSEAGTFSSVGEVLLSETPWDATFDCTNHLWVCLDDSSSPVLCYAWEQSSAVPVKIRSEEHPVLKSLCRWEIFAGLPRGASRRNWEQLRKQTFDNIGAYMARKEERIQANSTKKQMLDPHTTASEQTKEPLPPLKKTKLED